MRKQAYTGIGVLLGLAFSLFFAAAVQAGGWAVVTLDTLAAEVHAGQTYTIGMMVRQHGVTPISADPFEGGALVVMVRAHNPESNQDIEWQARQVGETGHFVADISFASAGSWTWEVQPGRFEATQLGELTILPAITQADSRQTMSLLAIPWLWIVGLLALGGGVLLIRRRRAVRIPLSI